MNIPFILLCCLMGLIPVQLRLKHIRFEATAEALKFQKFELGNCRSLAIRLKIYIRIYFRTCMCEKCHFYIQSSVVYFCCKFAVPYGEISQVLPSKLRMNAAFLWRESLWKSQQNSLIIQI